MGRYDKKHSYENLGIPFVFPLYARKTVITDRETGREAKALDWDSYKKSDRKAWEKLIKEK